MAYQPFLIANYNTGYQTAREPWMAPQDAFVTLENARCADGVLSKRAGTAQIAQMNHGGVANSSIITGMHTHKSGGLQWVLACNTLRPNVLNNTTGAMIDVSGDVDLFTGTARNRFWFLTLDGKTYFTNGVDGTYVFSGNAFDPATPATVAALTLNNGVGTFTGVGMYFFLNDRLLAYDIIDQGTHRAYRLRYSQTLARGNTPVFTGAGYLDVPTDDTPVTGRRLGRYIYLWHEHSLWSIGPSGDTTIPFTPQLLRDELGSKSRGVCIPFNKGILTVGHKDLVFFDGYETKALNLPVLNNILKEFSWSALNHSWGEYDEANQRIYITFTSSTGGGLPDRILEYNITEKIWALHKVSAQAMAMFGGYATVGWDDADEAYSHDGATMAEMPIESTTTNLWSTGIQREYPVYGTEDGWINRLFTTEGDEGAAFDFTATSARFNPFTKQGKRCALGRVAVLVDTSTTASFDVRLYKNTSTTAYKTQTITCTGSNDKHWESIHAGGEVGDFHTIEFYNNALNNTPVIHATQLEMEPTGRIDP